ncbi:hypothetical protein scyTo_0004559 [Scyliorhinus torazame]|uniref:Uncharacterized protein n=1 Tax=Scyliorhinus torazame TaxID=75743 RepID=A0A401NTI9_SCYTO|nr:hypothetical protein [Scyliorhinus torazame]
MVAVIPFSNGDLGVESLGKSGTSVAQGMTANCKAKGVGLYMRKTLTVSVQHTLAGSPGGDEDGLDFGSRFPILFIHLVYKPRIESESDTESLGVRSAGWDTGIATETAADSDSRRQWQDTCACGWPCPLPNLWDAH